MLSTLRSCSRPVKFTRALSSQARGLSAILEKKPDDVVVTFAKRTAMGKAKKGQLKDVPVDELMHALWKVQEDRCGLLQSQ